MLCLIAMSSQAQPVSRLSKDEAARQPSARQQRPPLLSIQVRERDLPVSQPVGGPRSQSAAEVLRRILPNSELYGNIFKRTQSDRGIYRIGVSPYSEQLMLPCGVFMSYGSALVGDQYYGCELYDMGDEESSQIPIMYQVDVAQWRVVQGLTFLSDYSMIAFETCVDQETNTVYGAFLNADASDLELAIVDYATHAKKVIGQLQNQYVAMGITGSETIYGVAVDGYLYEIDRQTAQETRIGATGVQVLTSSGQFYSQSGEINQVDDTFYWSAVDSEGQAALYTIDLASGVATKLADLEERILGMAIHGPAARDEAPAAVERLDVQFEGCDNVGRVVFTAPTTTFGGAPLAGTLDYRVRIADQLYVGTVEAGAEARVDVHHVPLGLQQVVVRTDNGMGLSPKATVATWVGYDNPQPATDVRLAIDQTTGQATLTWTPPTDGVHQGYIGALTYDVMRIVGTDTLLVATGLSSNAYSETLNTLVRRNYAYGVVAVNGDRRSTVSMSNSSLLGDAIEPPFFEDFLTQAAFDLWTTIDANGDAGGGYYSLAGGWGWCQHQMWGPGTNARYGHSLDETMPADDWLLSPPIALKAGRSYQFTVPIKAGATYVKERYEVRVGTADDPTLMDTWIVPDTEAYGTYDYVHYKKVLTMSEDGNYRIAIHAMSQADASCIMVDSVRVDAIVTNGAPAAVTELTVVPDAVGELQAQIRFRAPTTDVGGTALDVPLSHVDLLVNHERLHAFESVAPGQLLTYDVSDRLLNGPNTFTIVPYNDAGQGESTEQTLYVGVDVPQPLDGLRVEDKQGQLTFTWNAVPTTGANGGVVNPAKVEYELWTAIEYTASILTHEYINKVVGDTIITIDFDTEEGSYQQQAYWAVVPGNVAGWAEAYPVGLITGRSYTLPFAESTAGDQLDTYWDYQLSDDSMQIGFTDEASDADGSAFYMDSSVAPAQSQLNSGKIALGEALHPVLTFDLKGSSAANSLMIAVQPANGQPVVVATLAPAASYAPQQVSLEAFRGTPYVRIAFITDYREPGAFAIDNIVVADSGETGIADVPAPSYRQNHCYDLQGRSLGRQPRKGLYLQSDGKKLLAR